MSRSDRHHQNGSNERSDASGTKHSSQSADHSAKDPITASEMETIMNNVFERFMTPREPQTPPAVMDETALEKVFEKYMKPRDPQKPEEAWLKLADTAWAYEKDRVERWRNEINTLLVFVSHVHASVLVIRRRATETMILRL